MAQRNRGQGKQKKAPRKAGRKPYVSPQLIEYGNVEKLTRSSTGPLADATTMRSSIG